RLLVQLHTGEIRALPLAGRQRDIRLGDVAGEGQQQRHRVLGGGDDVGLRRVGNDDPPASGGLHIDVVHAHACSPDHLQVDGARDQLGRHLRGRADQDAVVGADALGQLLRGPVDAEIDVEALAQQLHARVADLLLDEDFQALLSGVRRGDAHAEILSTIQSIHAVSACTSPGSTAGNMPIRSWLRPSLRYGSVFTIPFARRVVARAAASTSSAKSMVPTTSERFTGSSTNGLAASEASAHPYRCSDEARLRETPNSSPPPSSSQSIWSASRKSVASAGVLYVWSLREFSSAVASERKAGCQRPSAPSSCSIRSIAAGLRIASQRPPSEANAFCGAK